MATQTLDQQTIDVIVEYLYVKFKLYFTDETSLLSSIPRDTKIGTIIDSVVNGDRYTLRYMIEEVTRSLAMNVSGVSHTGFYDKVDITPLVNFFTNVSINDVISHDIFLS